MNLLREQQEALTAELQQRRAEQESLLAQRDDLDSQLQVTLTALIPTCIHIFYLYNKWICVEFNNFLQMSFH